jgi:hypothetical protein
MIRSLFDVSVYRNIQPAKWHSIYFVYVHPQVPKLSIVYKLGDVAKLMERRIDCLSKFTMQNEGKEVRAPSEALSASTPVLSEQPPRKKKPKKRNKVGLRCVSSACLHLKFFRADSNYLYRIQKLAKMARSLKSRAKTSHPKRRMSARPV